MRRSASYIVWIFTSIGWYFEELCKETKVGVFSEHSVDS